jgi:hypothetical protein
VTESGLKLLCWILAVGLIVATLAVPQPVNPWEMPSLVLDRAAVSDAIRFERALAAEAPDSEEARALRSLFLDHGRAEANPPYSIDDYNRRQIAIHHATRALAERHGPSALGMLRAHAVEEATEAFCDGDHEPESEEEVALVGGFTEVARSYQLVRDGEVIAPELTIRSLYKARWNAIHRQPLVDGFSAIELQSYWGWLAFHGWGKPLEERRDALVAFKKAGGNGAYEAAALFELLADRPERAATGLQALYEERGELRFRNLGLGALHAAASQRVTP